MIPIVLLMAALGNTAQASDTFTHILYDGKFIGDKNQAIGIAKALGYEWKAYDETQDADLAILNQDLQKETERHVLIGIGEHGMTTLKMLNQPHTFKVWAGHQPLKTLKQDAKSVDLVFLPFKFDAPNAVETPGVAHDIHRDQLTEELQKWNVRKAQPIPAAEKYITIFLGGDAADIDKKMHYFTPEEAANIAHTLKDQLHLHKDAAILVVNSPTTGSRNPKTGEEQPFISPDATTKAFLQTLDKERIPYTFFPFGKGKDSAYKPILATLKASNNPIVFVTGDSTSMVSEIENTLPQGAVTVVKVGSMSDYHHAFVDHLADKGHITVIDGENVIEKKKPLLEEPHHETAAQVIAHEIKHKIENK